MQIPTQFRERYGPIAPDDFFERLAVSPEKTIRVNTLKTGVNDFAKHARSNDWRLSPLPWQPSGFRIDREDRSRPLGHSLAHFTGHFYLQEASSQIPPLALDPQPGERVLDLAAAPGSKTTQIAALMENQGLLVANDVSAVRLKSLTANLERVGTLNTVVTNLSGPRLCRFIPGYFDRVLLDAPCTAEGTCAINSEVLNRWSLNGIRKLSTLQSKLLAGAYQALRPGGVLVYSTCTFAPEENEGVLSEFLTHHPEACLEPIDLPGLDVSEGLVEWQGGHFSEHMRKAIRIWPGKERMEGFFIAKARKPRDAGAVDAGREFANRRFSPVEDDPGAWLSDRFGLPSGWDTDLAWVGKDQERWLATPEAAAFGRLPVIRRGLRTARTVRGGFKPTGDFCQLFGPALRRNVVELDAPTTRKYLAGQDASAAAKPGFVALRHQGVTFACGLSQGERIKNQVRVSKRVGA